MHGFHLVRQHLFYHRKGIYLFGTVHNSYCPHSQCRLYKYCGPAESSIKICHNNIRNLLYRLSCDNNGRTLFKCGDSRFLIGGKICTAGFDFLLTEGKRCNRNVCGIAKLGVKNFTQLSYGGNGFSASEFCCSGFYR